MTDPQSKPSLWRRTTDRTKSYLSSTPGQRSTRRTDTDADADADAQTEAERLQRKADREEQRTAARDQRIANRSQDNRGNKTGTIIGVVVALLVIVALIVGNISLRNDFDTLNNSVDQRIADAITGERENAKKAREEADTLKTELANKDKAIEAANKKAADAEKLTADKEAEKKAVQEQLDAAKRAAPGTTPGAPPVGNADGANTPPADVAQEAMRQAEIDRYLAQHFPPSQGWTRNITDAAWADIANNDPGRMVVGTSFAKTPEEAAAAAVNNPTVAGTYEEKANPANWALVYNPKCMEYGPMAFQRPDGSFDWRSGFVECGVMLWVNVKSGGKFRLLCDNGVQQAPVVTTKIASFPEIHPTKELLPPPTPPITTITFKNVQRCDVTTKKVVTISEEVAKDTVRYKPVGDIACQPVVVKDVQRCDVTTKKVVTISEEVAKDTVRYKPVGDIACQPVVVKDVQRCDVTTKKVVTISEEVAKDTVRYKPVGDIACQPVVVKDVQRCDVTTKKVVTISEEVAKDTVRYKPVGDIACQPVEVKDPNVDGFKDDDIDGTPAPPGPIDHGDVIEQNPAGPPSTDGNATGDEVVDLPADNADGGVVPDHGTPPPVPADVPSNPGGAPLEGDVDPDVAVVAPVATVAPAAAAAPVVAQPVIVAPVSTPAVKAPAAPAVAEPAPTKTAVATQVASAPAPAVAPAQAEVVPPTVVAAVSATTTG